MATAITNRAQTHRKLIDIPEFAFSALSVKAATMGTSLKRLIEEILVREANDMDDADIYRYLVSSRPEGKIMISEEEQADFEKQMGIRQNS